MASPRKTPVYSESPRRSVMRNGVEIPTLETGADDEMGGMNSPSPRVPIRTDAEVSPLQLTKKDKSKQRQQKLQDEKDSVSAAESASKGEQPATQQDESGNSQVASIKKL